MFRPFVGYNFGKYIQHWLDFEKDPHNKVRVNEYEFNQSNEMIFF